MVAMLVKLFVPLMGLGFISPIAAIIASCVLFARHRQRVEPERRVPGVYPGRGYLRRYRGLFRLGLWGCVGLPGNGQSLRLVGSFRYSANLLCAGNFVGWDRGVFNTARAEARHTLSAGSGTIGVKDCADSMIDLGLLTADYGAFKGMQRMPP